MMQTTTQPIHSAGQRKPHLVWPVLSNLTWPGPVYFVTQEATGGKLRQKEAHHRPPKRSVAVPTPPPCTSHRHSPSTWTLRWPLSRSLSRHGSLLMLRETQHSTAQHSTAQHSTAQHSTAQHGTAQHSTAQHNTTTPFVVLDWFVSFCVPSLSLQMVGFSLKKLASHKKVRGVSLSRTFDRWLWQLRICQGHLAVATTVGSAPHNRRRLHERSSCLSFPCACLFVPSLYW